MREIVRVAVGRYRRVVKVLISCKKIGVAAYYHLDKVAVFMINNYMRQKVK